jgi:uncharacterized protein (DUF2147 family)
MRRFSIALIAAAAGVALAAPVSADNSIAGRWRTDDGKAVITIAPCANGSAALCGRVSRILVAEPSGGARDTNNPNASLRERPLVGVQVFTNLTREGDRWTGRGYSPEEGRHFNATVRLESGRLNVRGCVSLFCRTMVWARAG